MQDQFLFEFEIYIVKIFAKEIQIQIEDRVLRDDFSTFTKQIPLSLDTDHLTDNPLLHRRLDIVPHIAEFIGEFEGLREIERIRLGKCMNIFP